MPELKSKFTVAAQWVGTSILALALASFLGQRSEHKQPGPKCAQDVLYQKGPNAKEVFAGMSLEQAKQELRNLIQSTKHIKLTTDEQAQSAQLRLAGEAADNLNILLEKLNAGEPPAQVFQQCTEPAPSLDY